MWQVPTSGGRARTGDDVASVVPGTAIQASLSVPASGSVVDAGVSQPDRPVGATPEPAVPHLRGLADAPVGEREDELVGSRGDAGTDTEGAGPGDRPGRLDKRPGPRPGPFTAGANVERG